MFTRWFSRRSILVFIRNYLLEGLFNNNNDDDLKVAHPQSGSSSTRFLIKLEFGNVGFWGVPGEKTSRSKGENQQQTQPTFGVDAGIWTQATLVGEVSVLTTAPSLAPHHHPSPCQKQYFYPPMLALFAYVNMLICLFLFRNIQHSDHVRDDNYYVWTFCRLISVRSLFWSNLKLLKGRQTPVTLRNMETWSVNLIIFEIFICWWKTGWLNRCHNCVHIDVQSPIIRGEGVHGSSLLLINKNIQCTLKGDSHFFFRSRLRFYSRYMYLLKSLQCTLF